MFKWSEVIEQNTEQLKEALQKALCDALNYRSMEFSVEIYPDGKIRTNEQAAGSNFQSCDSWRGNSLIIGSFCFENLDIEITDEAIKERLTEQEIKEAQKQAEEEGYTFLEYIFSAGRYNTIIEDCEEEYITFCKDEYALDESENMLERTLENILAEETFMERWK